MSLLRRQDQAFDNALLAGLLHKTSRGDRAAFTALYKCTASKLFGSIRRICGTEETAQEALQDTYVQIWKNAAAFDAALAPPLAWMMRIARNKAIDLRRMQSERISSLGVEIDEGAPAKDPDPLQTTEKNQDLRRLSDCLGGLEQDRRQMILLAYYNGFSREELSARFDKPVNTIKTLLRRGLAHLKECLDGHD